MLELKNISKSYLVNKTKQVVLKDINISFRDKEFVSILGASGSGKTTLLNIIGGLDSYDSGDLIINNISTKKYKSKDWDSYRNKKIGFVFQNYNLINHLSILDNVKLSLTLSGISKFLIKKKTIEALNKVGLKDHIHKKPNQLSGGQMQRVAIARALVNNPDIILADEPTGALDSNTSISIMNILKEISKDKLVIMVTHNEKLASKYSTRIIKIEDGIIVKDNNPSLNNNASNKEVINRKKNMSLYTSLKLSLLNMFTKKKRTLLTSFAASIGIVGIALVLFINKGFNNYINEFEKESISNYPIVIERKTYDVFDDIKDSFSNNKDTCSNNKLCVSNKEDTNIIQNNIIKFKEYISNNNNINNYASDIIYDYDIDLNIYNKDYKKIDDKYFNKIKPHSNYEVLYGKIPESYDELALVVSNKYISKDLLNILDLDDDKKDYSYDIFINKSFKLILNTNYYRKENGKYIKYDISSSYLRDKIDNGLEIKVVGILKDNNETSSSIIYTNKLINYLLENISKTDIFKDQINNKNLNIINNLEFNDYDNRYEDLEVSLGIYDINNPSRINIYVKDYKSKKDIIKYIKEYNSKQTNKEDIILYTDMMKSIVDSFNKIINIISYILIGFVSISLIVSSIMISIITYISVLERNKEIGILRAIGSSKKDIKRIFISEVIIEGFMAGVIGLLITYLLCYLINIIVNKYLFINNIASISIYYSIGLVVLSVFINILAGLKPARMASKKNAVELLRCE